MWNLSLSGRQHEVRYFTTVPFINQSTSFLLLIIHTSICHVLSHNSIGPIINWYFRFRVELCSFSGYKIHPGHGKRMVKVDGRVCSYMCCAINSLYCVSLYIENVCHYVSSIYRLINVLYTFIITKKLNGECIILRYFKFNPFPTFF